MTNGNIEIGPNRMRGNGRCHEVVVSAVKEYDCRTHLAAWRLVKADSNQNDLTGSKRH